MRDRKRKAKTNMDRKRFSRSKQYNKGFRNEAIRMLLSFGAISGRGLVMLREDRRYYSRVLKAMEEEGIINLEPLIRKTKIARLRDFENKSGEYLPYLKMGFYGRYNKIGKEINQDIGRVADKYVRIRAIREVEASMMMHGAGIETIWDNKGLLGAGEERGYYGIEELIDYSKTQVWTDNLPQTMIDEEKRVVVELASRSVGAMIGEGRVLPVYHSGDKLLKWADVSESRYVMFLRNIANSIGIDTIKNKVNACVVFGYDYSLAKRIMFPEEEAKPKGKLSVSNSTYGNIYFIPYIREARGILKRMGDERYEESLYEEVIGKKKNYTMSAADTVEDGIYYYNFCPSNITSFKSFIMQARAVGEPERYKVYCYSWQEAFVREVGGDDISIIIYAPEKAAIESL